MREKRIIIYSLCGLLLLCGSCRQGGKSVVTENIVDTVEAMVVEEAQEEVVGTVPTEASIVAIGAPYVAVDLGLPSRVKWAITNIGANNPSDFGDYFVIGEVKPMEFTPRSNSNLSHIPEKEIVTIGDNPNYDAATANWGDMWRMPNNHEFDELKTKCKWEWTNERGSNGYRITGPNGNSIFLPAAGHMESFESGAVLKNVAGFYWEAPRTPATSWRNSAGVLQHTDKFSYFYFRDSISDVNETDFYNGMPIRPVSYASYADLGIDESLINEAFKGYDLQHGNLRGMIADHEYVDLGLPSGVKWATMNMGANKVLDLGDLYEWGSTHPGEYYGSLDGGTLGYNKVFRNISGNEKYDAARKHWGGSWRLPTVKEMDELIDKCLWSIQTKHGHSFYIVKGPNKNTIMIPMGDFNEPGLWSSEPSSKREAYGMRLNGGKHKNMNSGIIVEDIQKTLAHIRPVSN